MIDVGKFVNYKVTPLYDALSKAGAEKTALRIEKFWKARGAEVHCHIVAEKKPTILEDGTIKPGSGLFGVRSDMINGMPRASKAA